MWFGPKEYRDWTDVETTLTPNAMNNAEAPFSGFPQRLQQPASLARRRKARSRVRRPMHVILECARRWELTDSNPRQLLRVRNATKRLAAPRALKTDEFCRIASLIVEPYRTQVWVVGFLGATAENRFASGGKKPFSGSISISSGRGGVARSGAVKNMIISTNIESMKTKAEPLCEGPHAEQRDARKPNVDEAAPGLASELFATLGEPARLRLLTLFAQGPSCVSEHAEGEREGMSTISQRLKVLRSASLVRRRRQGKHVIDSLADQYVGDLVFNALAHASEAPIVASFEE